MKKILITGGAGFLAYHTAMRLLEEPNVEITLVDNFSRGVMDEEFNRLTSDKRVSFSSVDLLDSREVSRLPKDFDSVFHYAAILGVQNVLNQPFEVLSKNTNLTLILIEHLKKCPNLSCVVFASTSEVYAGTLKYFGIPFPTPETTPLTLTHIHEPRTSYMLSKIYGEALWCHSGLPFLNVRIHNAYGPRMGLSHVIPELMMRIRESNGKGIEIFSPEHRRSFCFVSDVVEMIVSLSQSPGAIGKSVNVGNPDAEVEIFALARQICDVMGASSVQLKKGKVTPGSPERRVPDISLAVGLGGWRPQVTLADGIRKTYDWYSEKIFESGGISAK